MQDVTIEIFNIRGQRVSEIVPNRHYEPGIHSVIWNGTDDNGRFVGSGIYFYRMTVEGFSETRRMLLLK